MPRRSVLAVDLGAESGRAVLGVFRDGRFDLREIHRFANAPLPLFGRLHWDVYALFDGIKTALSRCAAEGAAVAGIAVDAWGVDFGLLAEDGSLLGLPFAYRDPRNVAAMNDFLSHVPRSRVYEQTGIQFLPFNSLFQLHALRQENAALLRAADRFLMIPDLMTYFLTGTKVNEATIASTSQLIDPRRRDWSSELVEALDLPASLFGRPCEPGRVVGSLLPALAAETGLPEIPVIATAGHDTAAAVAGVPAAEGRWAYLSSGTWSLLGVEIPAPVITADAERLNFTNEGGVSGTTRLLKNVTGLWLIQRCRERWRGERAWSYDELKRAALDAPPFAAFIDPDAPEFLNPADMPETIRAFCRATGQKPPDSPAAIVRCVLESLALKYRTVLDELRLVSPVAIDRLHIIGGGSRNEVLNRFTADAIRLPVVAGPAEATALGNCMVQALALGWARSLSDMRASHAAEPGLDRVEPGDVEAWDRAYARFQDVLRRRP